MFLMQYFRVGRSSLYIAAEKGLSGIVRTLIEESPQLDVNAMVTSELHNMNALHIAAMFDRTHTIMELLALGADINCKDGRGRTASDIARELGKTQSEALLNRYVSNSWQTIYNSRRARCFSNAKYSRVSVEVDDELQRSTIYDSTVRCQTINGNNVLPDEVKLAVYSDDTADSIRLDRNRIQSFGNNRCQENIKSVQVTDGDSSVDRKSVRNTSTISSNNFNGIRRGFLYQQPQHIDKTVNNINIATLPAMFDRRRFRAAHRPTNIQHDSHVSFPVDTRDAAKLNYNPSSETNTSTRDNSNTETLVPSPYPKKRNT